MPDRTYTVLFLSQRGSARSVIAAALLNAIGHGVFRASSAGVHPAQAYDSLALELLDHARVPAPEGAPQHYSAFSATNAVPLDFVFTLSDTAAGEPLPEWPGQPVTAHWSSADPERSVSDETERRRSLISTRSQLERRLRVFVNLPFESLDRLSLQGHVDGIGRSHRSDEDDGPGSASSHADGERVHSRRAGPTQTTTA
jgi:arsenate reductase